MKSHLGPHVAQILVVEDNPGDILLVKESFRDVKDPFALHFARNGEQALDFINRTGNFAKAQRPDLILLDLNLPKVSGMDVLARLKGDPALRSIPVLILSTSCSPADIQRAYALSANCYLCKPNTLEDFLHLMHNVQEFWLRLAQFPTIGFSPGLAP